jgi:two-component system phosphate regulon response regulator PhoB
MSKKRIIIIEDERDMADLVAMRLRREGYTVDIVGDGREGLAKIRSDPPDLALVDIMLPGMSGTDIVMELRHDPATVAIPVVLMTAKGEESDVILGLRLGADDYISKPFSMAVLVARVAAVLRRGPALRDTNQGMLKIGPIRVDCERHTVEADGRPVALTVMEFRLLQALASARGRVLTRNQLIDRCMGPNAIVTDRTIDVHLTSLRKKLGPARTWVETVRGIGYRVAESEPSGTPVDENA